MAEPQRHLVDIPEPAAEARDGYQTDVTDLLSYLSPSHWINAAVQEILGYDPFADISALFVGDWVAFDKCGVAYKHLAECMQDLGMNIQQGMVNLDGDWDGNAADAAYVFFSRLAAATSALQFPLTQAADQYARAALGIWKAAKELTNALEAMGDAIILAALCTVAGTATIETGVGPVIFYTAAAVEAAEILRLLGEVWTITSNVKTLVNGVMGAIDGYTNQGGSLQRYELSLAAYDHPAVFRR